MARIEQHGKNYRYVIEGKDEFGKRKRFTKSGFKTQREAKLAAAKAETNLQKNILEKNSYITLYDFIYKCWFPHHQNFIRQSSIYNLEAPDNLALSSSPSNSSPCPQLIQQQTTS